MNEPLNNLCGAGKPLQMEPPDADELAGLLRSGQARLHDARNSALAEARRLFVQAGLEDNLRFEHSHLAILERFGRYPHRNAILGRESTAEELAFLQEPGSGF